MLLRAAPSNLPPTGRPYRPGPRRGSRAAEILFPRLALSSPQPRLLPAPGRKGSCEAGEWDRQESHQDWRWLGVSPSFCLGSVAAWGGEERGPPGDDVRRLGALGAGEAVVQQGQAGPALPRPTPAWDKVRVSTDLVLGVFQQPLTGGV